MAVTTSRASVRISGVPSTRPASGAKRAAGLGPFLVDEAVEDVAHAQWVFTIPKMLRVCFLYHRELLGELSCAAAQTASHARRLDGGRGLGPGPLHDRDALRPADYQR